MNKNNDNFLWITWEKQRRNRSLSSALSATLIEINVDSSRVIRYLASSYQTIVALRKYRPNVFFVQNPSIVLASLALIYHKLSGTPLVIDAHNAGLFPSSNKHNPLNLIAKIIIRHTPITIVTNNTLCEYVESLGGNPALLPDPLPQLLESNTCKKIEDSSFNVLFICSWAEDEPYMNVINAARKLPDDVCIYITGNYKKKSTLLTELPENIVLTGFISEKEFDSMLHQCDLILDLTTRQDCLVCGAYEAVSAKQPLLLSDTLVLREYFSECAMYTDNGTEDIAKKIQHAKENIRAMKKNAASAKNTIDARWQQMLSIFSNQLAKRFPNYKL